MAKGSVFEREICSRLSEWWTGEEGSSVFWRTANSGGRATVRGRKGQTTRNHYGDVCATDPVGQPLLDLVTFELKRGYANLSLHDLMDQPTDKRGVSGSNYFDWIDKARRVAIDAGTPYWALITRRDRRESLIVLPDHFVSDLGHRAGVSLEDLEHDDKHSLRVYCSGLAASSYVWAFRLDDFLTTVPPDVLRKMAKRRKEGKEMYGG